jgi:hypothetical protein
MPFLSAAAEEVVTRTPLDTALTLGLVALLAVVVIIAVIRKAIANKNAAQAVEVTPVEVAPAPLAPGSAGQLKLHDVEPKTAAMLMAIVADKLGKPLNELHFISIKEVN